MGNNLTKFSKNYIMQYIPGSQFNQGLGGLGFSDCYSSHKIPEQLALTCYDLRARKVVELNQIQNCVHSRPEWISLFTYNVWFEAHNMQQRYKNILVMIVDSKADIICLQQVTPQFLQLLHQHSNELCKDVTYYMPQMTMKWYDTLIILKYPCRFYKKAFSSSTMDRCMLTAVIQFANPNKSPFVLAVNCVHLESLNNQKPRVQQLQEIAKYNQIFDMHIIAGDFNFSDGWPQNKFLEGYSDVWLDGKKHFSKWATASMKETGFTMPDTPRFPNWRPDHIVTKRAQKPQQQDQIAVLGDYTVPPYEKESFNRIEIDEVVRTPSDHFALLAKIQL